MLVYSAPSQPLLFSLADFQVDTKTLTVCYHIAHGKINIRKETSTSVNVFSIASYISMVTLLAHMHSFQADYPSIPLIGRLRALWNDGHVLFAQIQGSIERANS